MKKSEKIRIEMHQEENDLKALGLYTKVLREQRIENFETNWLPKFKDTHICEKGPNQSYIIYSARFGIIDYFPKADRCLLRKKQKWIKPALEWLVKNLLSETSNTKKQ